MRRPRTKGKVERMVFYLKDNFLAGREFADLSHLQAQGRHWLDQTANLRIHATTGQRPLDLLAREQLTSAQAAPPYRLCARSERRVDREGFVRLGCSRYSVPPEHVGRRVIVEQDEQHVRIRWHDLVIAEHMPASRPGACIAQPEHVEAMWQLSLARSSPPAALEREFGFQPSVAVTPLTVYEEVIG